MASSFPSDPPVADLFSLSEDIYRRILETTEVGVWILNPEGKTIFANQILANILGYSPSEMLGRHYAEFILDKEQALAKRNFHRQGAGTSKQFEFSLLDKKGHSVSCLVVVNPLYDDHKKYLGLVARVTNLSDFKEKEHLQDLHLKHEYQIHLALQKTTQALSNRNKQMSSILESIGDGFFSLDTKWRFTYLNKQAESAFGKKRKELLGQVFWQVFPEIHGSEIEIQYRKAASTNKVTKFCCLSPITNRWLDLRVYPNSEGLTVYFTDITNQRQTEEALLMSEIRFRTIVEQSPLSTQIFTPDGRCIQVNRAWEKLWGKDQSQVLGYNILKDKKSVMQRALPLIKKGFQGQSVTLPPIFYDPKENEATGPEHWIQSFIYPVKNEDGSIQQVVLVHQEVTEQMQAETTRSQLAAIVESSEDAILSKTLEGIITSWNHSAERIYGYTRQEALGKHISFITPPDYHAELAKTMRKLHKGERIDHHGSVRIRKDGQRITVAVTISPIKDANGIIIGASDIARDITEHRQAEDALEESKKRLEMAQQAAHIGTFDWDLSSNKLTWSTELEALYGLRPGLFNGNYESWMNTIHHLDRERVEKELRLSSVSGRDWDTEFRIIWPDNSVRWLAARARVYLNDKKQPRRMIGINMDITSRKWTEETQQFLAQASTLLASSLDYQTTLRSVAQLAVPHIADWCAVDIVENDGSTHQIAISHVDPHKLEYAKILEEEYPADPNSAHGVANVIRTGKSELVDSIPDHLLVKNARDERHLRLLRELSMRCFMIVPLTTQGKTVGTITFLSAESGRRYDANDLRMAEELAYRAALAVENARLYRSAQLEIQERKVAEATVRHQALHDALTALPNRILFEDRLTQALATAKRGKQLVAVMFLDLDRFKNINDTLGHHFGDMLLQQVAKRLMTAVRKEDTVARLSGDEFTIIINQVNSPHDAVKVAKKISRVLRPAIKIESHELFVNTSIGIALYPQNGEDVQTLLRNADTALYRAKEYGRNTYQLYSHHMNVKASERLILESNLQQALEKNQFTVHYQPIINGKSGEVIAAEALIRWEHPKHGIIFPNDFIPLAEEIGIIDAVSEWMVCTICKQIKTWQKANITPIPIAVNLSARQFIQKNLVEEIEDILKETEVSPSLLKLEITESFAMHNIDLTLNKLRRFKHLGVEVSIDDFGTGHSSLNYLKRLPVQTLKIDRSFVQDCVTNSQDAAIIKAIISMAHSLDLGVIAEGVETIHQRGFLQSLHCDALQGYLFSKPLNKKDFSTLLQERRLF